MVFRKKFASSLVCSLTLRFSSSFFVLLFTSHLQGSGTIDANELKATLEALGQNPTAEEIFLMISEVRFRLHHKQASKVVGVSSFPQDEKSAAPFVAR